jgi:hypothetical protein
LKKASDKTFVAGTITNEEGRFSMTNIGLGMWLPEQVLEFFQLNCRIGYFQKLIIFWEGKIRIHQQW